MVPFTPMGFLAPSLRIALASILLSGLAAVPACGSESTTRGDDGSGGASGSGGKSASGGSSGDGTSGGGGVPSEIRCGANTCEPQPIFDEVIAACCAADEQCGLDSSFLASFGPTFDETCQPRDQPGELDSACPDSVAVEVPDAGFPITFKGCCRSDVGRCGYMVDRLLGLVEIGLGCVDSEPFLDGDTAATCDPDNSFAGGGAGANGGENTSGASGAG